MAWLCLIWISMARFGKIFVFRDVCRLFVFSKICFQSRNVANMPRVTIPEAWGTTKVDS